MNYAKHKNKVDILCYFQIDDQTNHFFRKEFFVMNNNHVQGIYKKIEDKLRIEGLLAQIISIHIKMFNREYIFLCKIEQQKN